MDKIAKKLMFISRNMAKKNYDFLKAKGFTKMGIGQMPMAKIIIDNPGTHADDICKELELDKTTVALGLKRLIIGGLIKRETDEADRRKKKLFPTEKLLDGAKIVDEHINASINRLTDGFSKQELKNLNSYLDKMKENVIKKD